MEINTILALNNIGIDTEGALQRFAGNSAMYQKFLLKFPQDENYGKIAPALSRGDWDAALTAAHTLKGVSGNLGMNRLFRACSNVVTLLRTADYAGAAQAYIELMNAHEEIINALC